MEWCYLALLTLYLGCGCIAAIKETKSFRDYFFKYDEEGTDLEKYTDYMVIFLFIMCMWLPTLILGKIAEFILKRGK